MESNKYFEDKHDRYKGLTILVHRTIEELIRKNNIDYLSVTSRTKSMESFNEKAIRKGYKDPSKEIHDVSGIRVIVYIEADVTRVNELINKSFNVHANQSLDKTKELGANKIGYRSIHLICDLGKDRDIIPEYISYKGLVFEVQIRTVLQHAWAEIEHDRSYKFSGILPNDLQRRLYLVAGTLELVDREFNSLAKAIEDYSADIAQKTEKGDLDIPINTKSIIQYLLNKFPNDIQKFNLNIDEVIIDELKSFDISTLQDLDKILNNQFLNLIEISGNTTAGLLRDAMMFSDFDKYFQNCWNNHWQRTNQDLIDLLENKYDRKKIIDKFYDLDIEFINDLDENL